MSEREKQKVDFIGACTKDFSAPTCELMWNDAVAKVNGDAVVTYKGVTKDKAYADIAEELQKEKVKTERLEAQLRQSNTLLQRVNDMKKAEEEAEKERLTIDIMNNSRYTKDMLMGKSHEQLKIIADALSNTDKAFASVASDADSQRRLKERKLTVGQWDADKKEWVGGV